MAVTVDQLLPRLLAGIGEQSLVALEDHLDVHGPAAALRRWAPRDLIDLVESAGLRGHGGASFPDCLTLGSSPRRPPKSPGSRPIVSMKDARMSSTFGFTLSFPPPPVLVGGGWCCVRVSPAGHGGPAE